MSEAKFTKGEWSVQFEDMIFASCGVDNEQVAVVCNEENKDKNLIAAAPEMYKMLKSIADDNRGIDDGFVSEIDKLLAKARGES